MVFMDFTKKLTDNARDVLAHAEVLARVAGAVYVGTEHLLLGMLSAEHSVAGRVLHDFNIDFEKVESSLQLVSKADLKKPLNSTNGFSETAKLTLRMSIELANDFHQDFCGTEHLLYSVLSQKNSRATTTLKNLGFDVDEIMAALQSFLERQHAESYDMGEEELARGPRERQLKGSALAKFARNLTAIAEKGELDPVIGREREIERLITIITRRTKNNPVLIGEAGVGKTAIVEGLAQKIASGNAPDYLLDKKIYELDIAAMVAGTKYRGEFEERLKKVLDEVKSDTNAIIFIDELHLLTGAGAAEGSMDAANILKPALARGEFRLIGATTLDEYRRYIEKDAALTRRLQSVIVEAPNARDTVRILSGLAPKYENHHNVKLSPMVIEEAVRLSERYLPERQQPDKALDVIDEAAARVRAMAKRVNSTDEMANRREELKKLTEQMDAAVAQEDYERAALFKMRVIRLQESIDEMKKTVNDDGRITLKINHVASAVAQMTGVPVEQLQRSEAAKLANLEKHLSKHIIGQKKAISAVAQAIRRSRAGISDGKRPIGSFVFLGPTGVGKTELARVLAREVFGSDKNLIKVDMSEYSEKHTASRLIGAPAGYIGYDDGGQLTEKIRRQPYSVVLFDEIEKAHRDVFNLLLQILEDGRLTDGHGRSIDFTNTVVILTSNAGTDQLSREKLGFAINQSDNSPYHPGPPIRHPEPPIRHPEPPTCHPELVSGSNKKIVAEGDITYDDIPTVLRDMMRPELLNRFDAILTFDALSRDEIGRILDLMVEDLNERLVGKGIGVVVTNSAKNYLLKRGYDKKFGARPLRRTIQNELEHLIAEQLLNGTIKRGDMVRATEKNSKITITKLRETVPKS